MAATGVVIVTHNSREAIGACLDAVCKYCSGKDVIVVDNASSDGTAEAVKAYPVRLVENFTNAGFATAVNQGFRLLDTERVLVLNPDAVLETPLDALCGALEAEDVACAAGKLTGPDGKAQRGFTVRRFPTVRTFVYEALLLNRVWPSNRVNWQYRCCDLDLDLAQDVEQPAGAFLMVKRAVWAGVRGFDQSFWPVWFEDVDFCRRVRGQGWRIRYEPEAVARHTGGHSVGRLDWGRRQRYWYGNVLNYTEKHLRPLGGRVVCLAILVGITIRGIAGMFTERSVQPLLSSWEVSLLALGRLFAWRWRKPLG